MGSGGRASELPRAVSRALASGPDLGSARAELARAQALGLRVIPRPRLPERLRHVPDPPLAIWVRGAGLDPGPARRVVSIVGARRATPRALSTAEQFARALARRGVWVVSGLAYGVDAAAHRGALAGGGPTCAVLASGLDRATPVGNTGLARAILDGDGSWVSEHAPGESAHARHFPERNRLISGLADATLIVEAAKASGTLWTARHALEQGRDLWVVPGPVDSDRCRGSNALLREGAVPVLEPEDMFDELGLPGLPTRPSQLLPETSALGRRVLDALASGPRDVDGLGRELGLDAAQTAATLLELEMARLVLREGSRISLATLGGA